MKVVVINGSPRRDGLVSQMLGHVAGALPEGCEVETLFVRDMHDAVRPRHAGPALHRVYEMPFAGALRAAGGRRPPCGGGDSWGRRPDRRVALLLG